MAVYVIADTHLSETLPKPMDVFGHRWENWTEKLVSGWKSTVGENDTVVIPGDVSWGISLEEAEADLRLLDSLPGKKLLGRGNHDLWFSTMNKAEKFFAEKDFGTLKILFNNAFHADGVIITGCRGWFNDEKSAPKETDYQKIVAREAGRLRLSLAAAEKIKNESEGAKASKVVSFFHFPPVYGQFVCRELLDVLHEYGITECYFGHIHGGYGAPRETEFEGIRFFLISADHLDFVPFRVV